MSVNTTVNSPARIRTSCWTVLAGGLMLLLLTGCGPHGAAIVRSQRVLTPRKAPSLEVLEKAEPQRGWAIRQAVSWTGLLLEHSKVGQISATLTNQQMNFKLSLKNDGSGRHSFSTAVPISADGYFLTAAHCVNRDSLTLLAFDKQRKMVNHPARVVWQADARDGDPDLALLHVPMRPLRPFHLADVSLLPANSRVVITGYSGMIGNSSPPVAAGSLLRLSGWKRKASGAVWCEVEHSAPLNHGDSGGPLLTMDGRVVGINSEIQFGVTAMFRALLGPVGRLDQPFNGYNGLAVCPEAGWISRLVQADRDRQPPR